MPSIHHIAEIAAPRAALFNFSQDPEARRVWDPFIADLDGYGEPPTKGTKVTVTTWNRMKMTVEYVPFRRPECMAVAMRKGPSLLRSFGGSCRFDELDANLTRVIFSYSFTTRGGFLRPAFESIGRVWFSWDLNRRLKALKRQAERQFRR